MTAASGCSSSGQPGSQAATTAPALAGTGWVAEEVVGRKVLAKLHTTLSFDSSDRVSGSGGCNRYGGPVEIKGDAIRFGPLVATRMACGSPTDDHEQRFFTALEAASRFGFTPEGKLVLYDAQGGQVATFGHIQT